MAAGLPSERLAHACKLMSRRLHKQIIHPACTTPPAHHRICLYVVPPTAPNTQQTAATAQALQHSLLDAQSSPFCLKLELPIRPLALYYPLNPFSLTLSSRSIHCSLPSSPFSAIAGAVLRRVLKLVLPLPPLPPTSSSAVCPGCSSSAKGGSSSCIRITHTSSTVRFSLYRQHRKARCAAYRQYRQYKQCIVHATLLAAAAVVSTWCSSRASTSVPVNPCCSLCNSLAPAAALVMITWCRRWRQHQTC